MSCRCSLMNFDHWSMSLYSSLKLRYAPKALPDLADEPDNFAVFIEFSVLITSKTLKTTPPLHRRGYRYLTPVIFLSISGWFLRCIIIHSIALLDDANLRLLVEIRIL